MSSTLGAPLGGTMRGGHQVFESLASSLMTPPNGNSGAGICLPLITSVPAATPGSPVICCVQAEGAAAITAAANITPKRIGFTDFIVVNLVCCCLSNSSEEPQICRACCGLPMGL